MKVLVACEESQRVCTSFREQGIRREALKDVINDLKVMEKGMLSS